MVLEDQAQWYEYGGGAFVFGEDGLPLEFTGNVTNHDVNAVACRRSLFAGPDDAITITRTYSPDTRTLSADLEQYIEYDEDVAEGL